MDLDAGDARRNHGRGGRHGETPGRRTRLLCNSLRGPAVRAHVEADQVIDIAGIWFAAPLEVEGTMTPSVHTGQPHKRYCGNCGRLADTVLPGLGVCVRCGAISDLEPAAAPPGLACVAAPAAPDRSTLQPVIPAPVIRPFRAQIPPSVPQGSRVAPYSCHDCTAGCDFLTRFRDALRAWYQDQPGQRPPCQAIADKLNYTDRHLRRLRTRHGFGHWPPPEAVLERAVRRRSH